jgi:hypothetical protein
MHDAFDRLLGIPRTWNNRDFVTHVVDDYQRAVDAENIRLDHERRPGVKPRLPLTQYAGTYESEIYGRLVIKVADGTMTMQLGPNCHSELVHWAGERFRATFVLRFAEDWFVSFTPQDGRVAKLTVANVFPNKEIATFVRIHD